VGLVRIGKVVRAVGLKGHLGVAGTEGAVAELEAVTFQLPGAEAVRRRIEEARPQGRVWAVKVEGVSDRTAAERLVGAEVLAPREELPEAGEGRLLWADLEGLEVVTAAGAAVGRVTGMYDTGAVDVLVVTGPGGEKLVPLAPYVEVDLQARRIVVDPPEGLLDG
jgi:16S rRNA processing protein RimM